MVSAIKRASALGGLMVAGLLASTSVTPAAAADFKLTILHTNDMLSRLAPVKADGAACDATAPCYGGAARLTTQIYRERTKADHVLVLDAGNQFTGSAFYDQHKQGAISKMMNLIEFDAMAVGDREFNDGNANLLQFIKASRFPLLGANVIVERDPILKDQIYPLLMLEKNGHKIGLIGYSTEKLRSLSNPSPQVQIEPIEAAIKPWMTAMKGMGVTTIIGVSSAGIERDKQVAASIEGIDVIVGGQTPGTRQAASGAARPAFSNHGKDGAGPYPLVVKGPTGQPVLIVQAGELGRWLGRLDVTFDAKGVAKSWKGDSIELDSTVPEDQAMKDLVLTLGGVAAAPAPAATNQAAAVR